MSSSVNVAINYCRRSLWVSEGSQGNDTCPICLNLFLEIAEDPMLAVAQKCQHVFCKECLDLSISSGNVTCPLCRGSLSKDLTQSVTLPATNASIDAMAVQESIDISRAHAPTFYTSASEFLASLNQEQEVFVVHRVEPLLSADRLDGSWPELQDLLDREGQIFSSPYQRQFSQIEF